MAQEAADLRVVKSRVGVQRVMEYYGCPRARPPTDVLPALAQALGVSIETLLGRGPLPKASRTKNSRLKRRLKEIERLGARKKRQILQILATLLKKQKLKQRMSNRAERTT